MALPSVVIAPPEFEALPGQRAYRPRGRLRAAFHDRSEEIVVSGPAGTGKSRCLLEKLHLLAEHYPGMRGLIVRKTRESLTESALVTFEEKVLPRYSPLAQNQIRRVRQSYDYPNGSTIIVGGLDKPTRIMSTEYDVVYVQEAIELTEAEWEALSSRLRNGALPYQQIVGDTNPDAPSHWIKRRAARGQLRLIESRHEDNPTVTPDYLARLDALTGVRHQRLRLGLWVAAEGMIYEGWDPAVHLLEPFPVPDEWPRYRSVDFGYTNPFVCQWWAEDPDGRLYRYRELYGTRQLVESWGHAIHLLSRGERIRATVCDHDAEGRATLERHMAHARGECGDASAWASTSAATKDVDRGIQAVQERLRVLADGRPRLFLFRGVSLYRDADLLEAGKPTCTEEEVERYVWDRVTGGRLGDRTLEGPRKADDHGVDAMRYLVMHRDDGRSAWADAVGKSARIVYDADRKPEPSPFGKMREEMAVERRRKQEARHG